MSSVNININEAAVTAVREFNSFKGYGLDIFIEAQSSDCTLYLQVTLYDNEARRNSPYVRVGDHVKVAGTLKYKPYTKKDGTAGHSLLIERPVTFTKTGSGNSETLSQQNNIVSDDDDLFY